MRRTRQVAGKIRGKVHQQAKGGSAVAAPEATHAVVYDTGRYFVSWWRRLRARLTRREWTFLGVLLLAYGYFLQPETTNSISRWDMVYALAHGTTSIDINAANTIDVSFYHGHYYSPRSLGPSLLAVPVYWLLQAIFALFHMRAPGLTFETAWMNLLTTVPIALLAALVFARFVGRLRPELAGSALPIVAASAFALGTLFFPYANEFYGHALGGSLAFLGFYLLYRARTSPRPARLVFGAGLLVGYAVISEYPLAVVAAVLVLYGAFAFPAASRWRLLAIFIAGTLPSALLLAGYNTIAFGGPLRLSYGYVSGGEFQGQHSGLFGVTLPTLGGLVQILAWPRGLLIESPFLILLPLGFVRWWRATARPSAEVLVCAAIAAIYPLLISSYYLPMAGENLPGPRLLVPTLPFTCLALAWVVDEPRRWLRAGFAVLLGLGFLISPLFVLLGVREYHTYLTYPIGELFLPVLGTGHVPDANGATPPNLGTLLLQVPPVVSIWLFLIPFAVWCGVVLRWLLTYRRMAPTRVSTLGAPRHARTEMPGGAARRSARASAD